MQQESNYGPTVPATVAPQLQPCFPAGPQGLTHIAREQTAASSPWPHRPRPQLWQLCQKFCLSRLDGGMPAASAPARQHLLLGILPHLAQIARHSAATCGNAASSNLHLPLSLLSSLKAALATPNTPLATRVAKWKKKKTIGFKEATKQNAKKRRFKHIICGQFSLINTVWCKQILSVLDCIFHAPNK